ncbi:MAG: cytosine permease [Proteobacteria bacterium]|nr:cytosine permease [Pseudomonadota bacterium]
MSETNPGNPGLFELERGTIQPIPEDQRYGSTKSLIAIWGGMNMTPLTVVTGATATTALGLPLSWAIIAILVGNLLGGIGMALHSAQGPRLGVPQMLQARGQFGTYGAVIIVLVATIMFIGFFASNLVVAAQSATAILPSVGNNAAIVIGVVASFIVAIFGYKLVRFVTAISTFIVGALVVFSFIALAFVPDWSAIFAKGHFSLVSFSSMVAIGIVWQLAYAPYVSDYSRYMPKYSGTSGAFWGTYIGCVVSTIVLMALGSLVGLASTNQDTMAGLNALDGVNLGTIVLLGFAIAAWTGNAVNAYCSCLCALTLVETFVMSWKPGLTARIWMTITLHVVGMLIAFAGATNFVNVFFNFLTILLYALIPWSAINLIDYYVIRHGDYEVSDFCTPDGGRYGRWNTGAMIVFAIGVLAQIPFLVTTFYTGAIATALHGVDIAWFVGLTVSIVGYVLLAKFAPHLCRIEPQAAAAQ